MREMYENNRRNFFSKMKDNSVFVSFAGSAPAKQGDQLYPFAPHRTFLYLTGIDHQKLILVMTKKDGCESSVLFVERFDEVLAKWDGAVLSAETAAQISGIDDVKYLDEFDRFMQPIILRGACENMYLDLNYFFWDQHDTPSIVYAEKLRHKCPRLNIENAHSIMASLRSIKSEDELRQMKKAVAVTNEGLKNILSNLKPGMFEYQAEAYFDFSLKYNGAGRSFPTIAASGKNATVLHYSRNNSKIEDGSLILFDLGAEWNWYAADISRTYPANGRFTERQKQLYNIVLEAGNRVIAKIKPGVMHSELNNIVIDFYAEELKKIGLIQDANEVSKYYYHRVGHALGLDTHDITTGRDFALEKGMVITVEPGLYVKEEGIGIRIEDDVLVTDDGCDVLSKDIVKTVDDIEAFMTQSK